MGTAGEEANLSHCGFSTCNRIMMHYTTPGAGDGDLVAEALLALGWARLEALGHAAVALARVVPLS